MTVKFPLFVSALLLVSSIVNAQSGCTDPAASNYNAAATSNDGSCIYPVTHSFPPLRTALATALTESSGLVWTNGKLWTHNDSGNPAEIYSVDTTTGAILQTVIVDNYPNTDWEDITADSNYIYIGDHGNNSGDRTDLKVLKIAKSDITSAATVHVNAQAISFSYTDQTSFTSSSTHNFDCEALMSIRDSLYIFTKDRGDGQSRVYKMPKNPGTYALTPYTSFNVNGLITGADYNAITHNIVLVGYMHGHLNSFLWYLSDYHGDMFFSGNKRRIEIGDGSEWQTEAVCWMPGNRIAISCETSANPASLYFSPSTYSTTAVGTLRKVIACNIYPNPTCELLYVANVEVAATYYVRNMSGHVIKVGSLISGNNSIDIRNFAPGDYILEIKDQAGEKTTKTFTKL